MNRPSLNRWHKIAARKTTTLLASYQQRRKLKSHFKVPTLSTNVLSLLILEGIYNGSLFFLLYLFWVNCEMNILPADTREMSLCPGALWYLYLHELWITLSCYQINSFIDIEFGTPCRVHTLKYGRLNFLLRRIDTFDSGFGLNGVIHKCRIWTPFPFSRITWYVTANRVTVISRKVLNVSSLSFFSFFVTPEFPSPSLSLYECMYVYGKLPTTDFHPFQQFKTVKCCNSHFG